MIGTVKSAIFFFLMDVGKNFNEHILNAKVRCIRSKDDFLFFAAYF